MKLHGMSVILTNKTLSGYDEIGEPVYTTESVTVDDVIVSPASAGDKEVLDSLNLDGKKALYTLGIPKGDEHSWEDSQVTVFGRTYRTYGPLIEGQEDLVPLRWHKKISLEWIGNG